MPHDLMASIVGGSFWVDSSEDSTNTYDVLGGKRKQLRVLDHGLASLVDMMPRIVPVGKTAEFAIVQAARVSYGDGTKTPTEDTGLVRFLMRHRHTTPVEMIEMKFHFVMPIMVARQWVRHRTASMNEYSARYSLVKDVFYRPNKSTLLTQDPNNKQGACNIPADQLTCEMFEQYIDKAISLYSDYEALAARGLARETARNGLPVNVYTEFYWKIDLHNLLHFLGLRMDTHAQWEIRQFANAIYKMIEPLVPNVCQAFMDYHPNMDAMLLTKPDIDAMNGGPLHKNKRELQEYLAKMVQLNNTRQIDRVELELALRTQHDKA